MMHFKVTTAAVALSAALAAPLALAAPRGSADPARDQQDRRPSEESLRFRAMDSDNDGVITRAEWRGTDQGFREQDTNGDGVLSGDEVRRRATARNTPRDDRDQDELNARFRGMDSDNDGVITRAEWRGNAQSFRQQDTNGDGVLSGSEVWVRRDATAGRIDRNRQEEIAARFDRADRNRDGRLDRDEWAGTRAAFNRMDRDRDDTVTFDEFSTVVEERAAGTSGTAAPRTATRAYQSGYDKGLIEGRDAGRADKGVNGGTWDLEGQRELEQADSGYRSELGDRADYQAGYRAGFRVGYREGFGPRR
jgi:Ca2+-binding EF-hand superfamily protein